VLVVGGEQDCQDDADVMEPGAHVAGVLAVRSAQRSDPQQVLGALSLRGQTAVASAHFGSVVLALELAPECVLELEHVRELVKHRRRRRGQVEQSSSTERERSQAGDRRRDSVHLVEREIEEAGEQQ
jgi:hypothetical protein